MTDALYSELTYYLRGLGFRVHGALRGGHREELYEEALIYLLEQDGMPYVRQQNFVVGYKGHKVGSYRPDLILATDAVVVELKAVLALEPLHRAQIISYLAVTNAQLGFLMNFGAASLQTERLPNRLAYRRPPVWQPTVRADTLYPELTNAVMAAAYTVHYQLGPGFLHSVYRAATKIELAIQGIQTIHLTHLPVCFEGHQLALVDTNLLAIEDKFLLATVALSEITDSETERMRWALKTTGHQLGLIANFHPTRITYQFIRA